MATEISVPDIGDFESVEIIEILVKPGDTINKNDPIVTLESDKSSVEVPSPFAGKISSLKVKIGDKVSKGNVLALIEAEETKPEQKSKEQKKEEKIIYGNSETEFKVDTFKKKCLLEGLDDIALSLKKSDKIENFEKNLKHKKPWIFND